MGPILLVGFLGLVHATGANALKTAVTEVPFLQQVTAHLGG